ncbi:MAG TPA: hypothetical protein VFA06_25370 [Actinocrinis sp.]|uniref:hypothetical protein n=1 Tax=Actinocrinis sp. TaxID=1920516 RepID=UPI002D64E61C|nr:hypothetical protein [Actinocrinis sp.]HZU59236.1 hypothetical protein [Actinocrinis sp.]
MPTDSITAATSRPGSLRKPGSSSPLRQRLRDALSGAIKNRDKVAVAALRSTLAAIDNAEAVEAPQRTGEQLAIEQLRIGVGSAEVARRELTEAQIERIVRGELAEREAAARDYQRAGRIEHAERLRGEIRVLSEQLGDRPAAP